jgi:signal transduction histidine kinase/integral membrane sensor domain MASE1
MELFLAPSPKKRFLLSFIALGYFLTGGLTTTITGLETAASPIWLPAALALTALFLWGEKFWFGVFCGDFLLMKCLGDDWLMAFFSALGSSLSAVLGAKLLKSCHFSGYLTRICDVMALVFLGALLASAVNATLNTIIYAFSPRSFSNLHYWAMIWLGDSAGILVFAPFLLRFYLEKQGLWRGRPRQRIGEACLCLLLLLLVGIIVFGLEQLGINTLIPPLIKAQYLEYLPFPFVVWAALRFQTWGAVSANFLLSLLALVGTLKKVGPFMQETPSLGQGILLLQMFLAIVTTTSLFLAAAVAEREKIEKQLRASLERENLMAQTALRIYQSLDLGAIFQTTVQEIRFFLDADHVYIAYLQEQTQVEIVAESLGKDFTSLLGWTPPEDLREAITNFFRQADVLLIENTEKYQELPVLSKYFQTFLVRSALILPLKVNQQPLGVLVVQQYTGLRPWQKAEVKLLEQLAAQVSVAIEQAQLYQRVQRLNSNLELEVQERTLELREKVQELKRLYEMKTVFLQAVSHDLRTSMMGLIILLKNLDHQKKDCISVSRPILEQMVQQSDRQLTLLNALSEDHFALESLLVVNATVFSLTALLEELLATAADFLNANQAQVLLQIPADLPPISGDSRLIRLVYENLLNNALKHNPPGRKIILAAHPEKGMLRCSFTDDGLGMNELQCQAFFKLYVRSLYNPRLTGIGLGSYRCRQIITAHGGRIGVESQPNEGTEIWFTLPLVGKNPKTP